MKRILCLFSVLVIAMLALSGCSTKDTENLTKLTASATVKDGKTSYSIGKLQTQNNETYYFSEDLKLNGDVSSFGSKGSKGAKF